MIAAGAPAAHLPPAPVVPPELAWVWRAWHRLSGDRPWIGGGMGPPAPGTIPWGVVDAWVRRHAMSVAEAEFLDRCFAAMDRAFLEHWRATAGKSAEGSDDKQARWRAAEG